MVFDRKTWERAYRKKNREKINAKQRTYRQKNRERILSRRTELRNRPEAKEKRKAYDQRPEVKESNRKRQQKYREADLEHYQIYHRQWYQQNRRRLLKMAREYHAKPEVKLRERKRVLLQKYGENGLEVFKRDGFTCQKCGSTKDIEVHHIDLEKTNNALENLIVLCTKCHGELHNFVPLRLRRPIFDEWMKEVN